MSTYLHLLALSYMTAPLAMLAGWIWGSISRPRARVRDVTI